jgi:hypothetical protein
MNDLTPSDDLLRETANYIAIRRLQSAYADVVTRRAWPELEQLLLPDARVVLEYPPGRLLDLVGPRMLADHIDGAIPASDFFEFVVLNTVLTISPTESTATGRMYMCAFRGEGEVLGVYHDRYKHVDGRWWFDYRRYDSLASASLHRDKFSFPGNWWVDG